MQGQQLHGVQGFKVLSRDCCNVCAVIGSCFNVRAARWRNCTQLHLTTVTWFHINLLSRADAVMFKVLLHAVDTASSWQMDNLLCTCSHPKSLMVLSLAVLPLAVALQG